MERNKIEQSIAADYAGTFGNVSAAIKDVEKHIRGFKSTLKHCEKHSLDDNGTGEDLILWKGVLRELKVIRKDELNDVKKWEIRK